MLISYLFQHAKGIVMPCNAIKRESFILFPDGKQHHLWVHANCPPEICPLPKALFQKLFSKCPPNLTALPKNCPHPKTLFQKPSSKCPLCQMPSAICPLPFALCHLPSSKCPPLKGVIGRGHLTEGNRQRANGRGYLTEGNWQRENGRGQLAEGKWQRAIGRGQNGRGQLAEGI